MNWPQAEKAVRAGKAVRYKRWLPDTRIVMWRGHMIRITRHGGGNYVTRRFWSGPGHTLWLNNGWEVAEDT